MQLLNLTSSTIQTSRLLQDDKSDGKKIVKGHVTEDWPHRYLEPVPNQTTIIAS